jgi:hypothetical protein
MNSSGCTFWSEDEVTHLDIVSKSEYLSNRVRCATTWLRFLHRAAKIIACLDIRYVTDSVPPDGNSLLRCYLHS